MGYVFLILIQGSLDIWQSPIDRFPEEFSRKWNMQVLPIEGDMLQVIKGAIETLPLRSTESLSPNDYRCMEFKRHKIFASGVHKNENSPVWPKAKVLGVFESTKANSPLKIPYTYRHPQNNLPVLGYADRNSVEVFEEDDRTYLTAQPLDFAKDWIAGLKKAGCDKVSIGLGRLGEIVHIGFTDNPAVVGLGAAFEASNNVPAVYTEEVEFEASDLGTPVEGFDISWKWQLQSWMQDVAGLFQKMRDKEIEANGIDAAEKFLPSYVMDFLKLEIPVTDNNTTQFETDMSREEKEELERLRTENAALLQSQSDTESLKVQTEILGFCAKHQSVITPKIKDQIVGILTDLHGAQPRHFEVDGATVEKSSFDVLKELFSGAKPQIVFEEVATNEEAPEGAPSTADPVLDALTEQFEAAKTGK